MMDKHTLYPMLRTGVAEKHRGMMPKGKVLLVRYDHPDQDAVVFRFMTHEDAFEVEDALREIFPSLRHMNIALQNFCRITGTDRTLFHLLPRLETP